MGHIDAFSRAPISTSTDTEGELLDGQLDVFITMTEEEQVMAMQRTDTKLRNIMGILGREQPGRSDVDRELVKNYQLQRGMLYKRVKEGGE